MVEALSRRTQRDGDINPFGTRCLAATNGQVREAFSRDDQTEEGPMAEMNRISRFFVNRSSARRNTRIYEWIRANLPPGGSDLPRNRLRERRHGGAPRGWPPSGAVRGDGPRPAAARRGTGGFGEAVPEWPPGRLGASDRGHAGPPVPGRVVRRGLRLRHDPPRESETPRFRQRPAGPVRDRSRPEAHGIPGLRRNRAQGEHPPVAPRSRPHALRGSTELEARVGRGQETRPRSVDSMRATPR